MLSDDLNRLDRFELTRMDCLDLVQRIITMQILIRPLVIPRSEVAEVA